MEHAVIEDLPRERAQQLPRARLLLGSSSSESFAPLHVLHHQQRLARQRGYDARHAHLGRALEQPAQPRRVRRFAAEVELAP